MLIIIYLFFGVLFLISIIMIAKIARDELKKSHNNNDAKVILGIKDYFLSLLIIAIWPVCFLILYIACYYLIQKVNISKNKQLVYDEITKLLMD